MLPSLSRNRVTLHSVSADLFAKGLGPLAALDKLFFRSCDLPALLSAVEPHWAFLFWNRDCFTSEHLEMLAHARRYISPMDQSSWHGAGYCRLQMPFRLALAIRETVAGRRLGALGGGQVTPPLPNASPGRGGGVVLRCTGGP